jgi:hypothetical protein
MQIGSQRIEAGFMAVEYFSGAEMRPKTSEADRKILFTHSHGHESVSGGLRATAEVISQESLSAPFFSRKSREASEFVKK